MRLSLVFVRSFFIILFSLTPVWGILAIIISVLGILVGVIEEFSWNEGLYFGWITATTVGYGDITPTRPFTRLISIAIGLIGIINTGIYVSIAVEAGRNVIQYLDLRNEIVKKVKNGLGSLNGE